LVEPIRKQQILRSGSCRSRGDNLLIGTAAAECALFANPGFHPRLTSPAEICAFALIPFHSRELFAIALLRKVKAQLSDKLLVLRRVFMSVSSNSGAAEANAGSEETMKSQLKFALCVALGTGMLGAGAVAQQQRINANEQTQLRYATLDPSQTGQLQQVDWDHHRRCDGDGDRDDRGCYKQYGDRYPVYYGNGYYGNGYYAAPAPHYAPPVGWYDRDGRWHAYQKDRDRDRHRHDDDDRR
jgi:hypothetical protein